MEALVLERKDELSLHDVPIEREEETLGPHHACSRLHAVAMLASGAVDVTPPITDRCAFTRSVEAFDFARETPPRSVKIKVRMPV